MMEEENTKYRDIEAYLSGELEGEALTQMESRLKADEDFASEVQVNRNLTRFLSSDAEHELEESLAEVGRQFTAKKNYNLGRRGIQILLLVFMVLLSKWYFYDRQEASVEISPAETILPPSTVEPAKEEAPHPIEPESPVQEKTVPVAPRPEVEEPAEQPSSRPIAAHFAPNPLLEDQMGNTTRSIGFEIALTQPNPNYSFKRIQGEINFQLKGQIKTSEEAIETPLQLLLFNNKVEAYEAYQPIKAIPLTLGTAEEAFSFSYQESLNLSSGLYYMLIEDMDTGELYKIQKFRVE